MIAAELLGVVFVVMEGEDHLPALVEVGSAEVTHPDSYWRITANCLQRSGYMAREPLGYKFTAEGAAIEAADRINKAAAIA